MDKEKLVFPNWLKQRCRLIEDNKTGNISHMDTRAHAGASIAEQKACDADSISPGNFQVLEEHDC